MAREKLEKVGRNPSSYVRVINLMFIGNVLEHVHAI